MRTATAALLLLAFAVPALAAPCPQKRNREPAFIELAVPEDAIRPAGPQDFSFVDESTTIDQLFAKVGPPDASSGSGTYHFIYCFADGTELRVISRDRVQIDGIRHEGRQLFKRRKPQVRVPAP
jgi:hypothetical protein